MSAMGLHRAIGVIGAMLTGIDSTRAPALYKRRRIVSEKAVGAMTHLLCRKLASIAVALFNCGNAPATTR